LTKISPCPAVKGQYGVGSSPGVGDGVGVLVTVGIGVLEGVGVFGGVGVFEGVGVLVEVGVGEGAIQIGAHSLGKPQLWLELNLLHTE